MNSPKKKTDRTPGTEGQKMSLSSMFSTSVQRKGESKYMEALDKAFANYQSENYFS